MRLRNNKSINENLQDSIHEDQIDACSDKDDVTPTPRTRNNRSRKRKKNGSNIDTSCNEVSESETSEKIVGVTKRKNGKYGVKIHDRIRKKDVWLGTYECAEEATRVYWAKKEELEKEFEAFAERVCETKRTSEFVGVSMRASGKFAAHIRDPIRKKKLYLGAFLTEEEASKAYLAKKAELEKEVKGTKGVRQWCRRRECRRPTSLDLRKRRSVGKSGRCNDQESSMVIDDFEGCDDQSASSDSGISLDDDQCLVENQESSKGVGNSFSLNGENGPSKGEDCEANSEQNNEEACSDNQESSKEESDHSDIAHKETSSMDCGDEDLPIQKNSAEEELIVVDSSVESLDDPERCSDGKILLRTKSGTPLMDCNGFLLGEWSCIDDLSLSSNL